MIYGGIRIPEELGERALEILGLPHRSRPTTLGELTEAYTKEGENALPRNGSGSGSITISYSEGEPLLLVRGGTATSNSGLRK